MRLPPRPSLELPGHRAGVPDSLSSVPLLILAALVAVYMILGMLYESYIHPLTILSTLPSAGVGALRC
jgi:HAE1 family hydrophobic/amphiphilic exporter-1